MFDLIVYENFAITYVESARIILFTRRAFRSFCYDLKPQAVYLGNMSLLESIKQL